MDEKITICSLLDHCAGKYCVKNGKVCLYLVIEKVR